jgi:hypothetical protein
VLEGVSAEAEVTVLDDEVRDVACTLEDAEVEETVFDDRRDSVVTFVGLMEVCEVVVVKLALRS